MEIISWLLFLGFVIALTGIIFMPSTIACGWLKLHSYSESELNSEGHWQTECKTKGCGSKLVLKGRNWEEKGKI